MKEKEKGINQRGANIGHAVNRATWGPGRGAVTSHPTAFRKSPKGGPFPDTLELVVALPLCSDELGSHRGFVLCSGGAAVAATPSLLSSPPFCYPRWRVLLRAQAVVPKPSRCVRARGKLRAAPGDGHHEGNQWSWASGNIV